MSSSSTASMPASGNSCCLNVTKTCCSTEEYTLNKKAAFKKSSLFSFDVTIMQAFKQFIAEIIGTALLMFGGCMGCISWKSTTQEGILSSLSFGLVVMVLIQCYGHISGAHFNPAVTACAVVFRLITIPMAIVYFFAQMIGAMLGYRLLQALTPTDILAQNAGNYGFCATAPYDQLSVAQAFFIEYFATMILISTYVFVLCYMLFVTF